MYGRLVVKSVYLCAEFIRNSSMGKLSRNTTSFQVWEKFVGPSKDNFPWSHLPTKKVVLQRYRAIRSTSGISGEPGAKYQFIQVCWSELKDLWDAASIPMITQNNGKKKIQELVDWFAKLIANKRYLEDCSERYDPMLQSLNQLFDIAPKDVELQMKASLNKSWKEDFMGDLLNSSLEQLGLYTMQGLWPKP